MIVSEQWPAGCRGSLNVVAAELPSVAHGPPPAVAQHPRRSSSVGAQRRVVELLVTAPAAVEHQGGHQQHQQQAAHQHGGCDQSGGRPRRWRRRRRHRTLGRHVRRPHGRRQLEERLPAALERAVGQPERARLHRRVVPVEHLDEVADRRLVVQLENHAAGQRRRDAV